MASIGSLTANLSLQSASFRRNLTRAAGDLRSSTAKMQRDLRGVRNASRQVEKSFRQLRAGAVALGGALAVRQFAQFTKATLASADAVAKQADRIGFSTKALQEYRLVSQLVGVDVAKLDQGLGAFVKRLGELRSNGGALNTLLIKTNKRLKEQLIAARSTEAGFAIFINALAETKNQADRVALSAAGMSRTVGIAMANLVSRGADAVVKLRKEMSDLGLVMREEVLRAAERVTDDLTLLQKAFAVGFDTELITALAGSVERTADSLKTAREIGESFGRAVGKAMAAVAQGAKFVAENLRAITAALSALVAFKVGVLFTGAAVAVAKLAGALKAAVSGQLALNAATLANPLGLLVGGLAAAAAAAVVFRNETVVIGDRSIRLGNLLTAIWASVRNSIRAAVQALKAFAGGVSLLAQGEFTKAFKSLEKGLLDIGLAAIATTAQWKGLSDAAAGTGDVAERVLEAFKKVTSGVSSAAAATMKFDDATGDVIKKLQIENRQLTDLSRAHERGAVAVRNVRLEIEIENAVLALGKKATDEQRTAVARLVAANSNLKSGINELTEARRKEADAAREATEKFSADAAERARLLEQPFLNAATGIQNSITSAFESIFSGGVRTFSSLAETIKGIFIRLAAELATLKLFGPSIVGLVGGVGGAAGLSGAGGSLANIAGGGLLSGATGAINSFGASIGFGGFAGGTGPAAGSFAASQSLVPAQAGSLTSASLSGVLGAAGLGALGGSLLGGLVGSGTGGTIGGGLGAGLGFAVGGPIGGIIGGLAGGLGGGFLGGLFGPKPSVGPNATARLRTSGGRFAFRDAAADNDGPLSEVTQTIKRVGDTLNTIIDSLNVSGIARSVTPRFTIFPGRGGFESTVAGRRRDFGKDAEGAFNDLVIRSLKAIRFDGLSDVFATAIRNTRAKTVQALTADLDLARLIDSLRNPVSALDQAIKGVTDRFGELIGRAKQLRLGTSELVAQREREIEAIRLQARSPFLEGASNIVGFLNAQSLSAASTSNPVSRLAEAQRQFGDVLGRVRGGEVGLVSQLTQSAGGLLSVGRENFASSVNFANLEGFVRTNLLSVADLLSSESFFDAQVEATRQQTSVLAESQDRTTAAVERLEREIRFLRDEIAA